MIPYSQETPSIRLLCSESLFLVDVAGVTKLSKQHSYRAMRFAMSSAPSTCCKNVDTPARRIRYVSLACGRAITPDHVSPSEESTSDGLSPSSDTRRLFIEEARVINNAAVPATNDLSAVAMAHLVREASLFLVAIEEADRMKDDRGVGPGAVDEAVRPGAGERVVAMIMCLGPGADYDSPNYQYFLRSHVQPPTESFSSHASVSSSVAVYRPFLYVDRLVVAEPYRGRGIGKAMYAQVTQMMSSAAFLERHDAEHNDEFVVLPASIASAVDLCCEVNIHPPNPESMAFHIKCGFGQVGEQETEGGKKRVALLVAPVIVTR